MGLQVVGLAAQLKVQMEVIRSFLLLHQQAAAVVLILAPLLGFQAALVVGVAITLVRAVLVLQIKVFAVETVGMQGQAEVLAAVALVEQHLMQVRQEVLDSLQQLQALP